MPKAKNGIKLNNKNKKTKSKSALGGGSLVPRGSGSVNSLVVQPWMPIFPASIIKRLRYSTTFSLTTTAGAITGTQVFRANDLFDPDFSGTGHQPMGFDQMCLWYNHFCVLRSRLVIVGRSTVASSPTICLRVDGDSSAITVIDRIVELGGNEMITLDFKSGYGAVKELDSKWINIPKLQGVTRSTISADANLRGSAAVSPVEVTYFHVTLWDTTTTTGAAQFDAILEQEALFFEPRDVTESLSSSSVPDCRLNRRYEYEEIKFDYFVLSSTPRATTPQVEPNIFHWTQDYISRHPSLLVPGVLKRLPR